MSGADTQKSKQSEASVSKAAPMSAESVTEGVGSVAEMTAMMRTFGDEFSKTMPSPKVLPDSKQVTYMKRIEQLVGAKTADDRKRLIVALVHVGIENGTGPNADYKDIPFVPGGSMRSVPMSDIVDKIVTRANWRKFMNSYGDYVQPYLEANPQVYASLAERATRSGVPLTSMESVVDFGKPSVDNPDNLGYRHVAKTSAVNRANSNTDNSLYARAKNAVFDARSASDGGGRSSAAQNQDRYGPL